MHLLAQLNGLLEKNPKLKMPIMIGCGVLVLIALSWALKSTIGGAPSGPQKFCVDLQTGTLLKTRDPMTQGQHAHFTIFSISGADACQKLEDGLPLSQLEANGLFLGWLIDAKNSQIAESPAGPWFPLGSPESNEIQKEKPLQKGREAGQLARCYP